MFKQWINHCYIGPCEFNRFKSESVERFTIQTDAPNSRGSWLSYFEGPFSAGDTFIFTGQVEGPGHFIILFFNGSEIIGAKQLQNETLFTVPPETDLLRLDLRLWDQQDQAQFSHMAITRWQEPEKESRLPIPPPNLIQKYHVTGWKWGRNIMLMVHGEEISPPNYGIEDEIIPYEVRGFQHGRRLDLHIGNLYLGTPEQ